MTHNTAKKRSHTGIISTILVSLLLSAPHALSKERGHHHDINKIMGNITVHDGEQLGVLKSVNGSIYINNNATVEEVKTVNGSIKIDDNVTMKSASTVNGSIRGGTNLQIHGGVATVNGEIILQSGTRLDQAETVNGDIELTTTQVGKNLSTVNGSITLTDNSSVLGDIIFEEDPSHFGRSRPTLSIDSSSTVSGTIHLYQEVTLKIDDSASVGEIIRHH